MFLRTGLSLGAPNDFAALATRVVCTVTVCGVSFVCDVTVVWRAETRAKRVLIAGESVCGVTAMPNPLLLSLELCAEAR